MLIIQTINFSVQSKEIAEVGRSDGGHIIISAKFEAKNRMDLTPDQAIEFMLLSIITGKAMMKAMKEQGITLGLINFQENGNWTPHLHLHLYGRAIDAKYQIYGHPIKSAWTKEEVIPQESLTDKDVKLIRKYIIEYSKVKGFEAIKLNLSEV